MNSQKFRNHPGGMSGVIKLFKLVLLLGVLGTAVATIIGLIAMFGKEISIYVTSNTHQMGEVKHHAFNVTNVRSFGLLHFNTGNGIEWLFFPRYSDFDVYVNLISCLITWQLYRIFSEINVEAPFYKGILRRITLIYRFVFIGFIFISLRHVYVVYAVNEITNGAFQVTRNSFLSSEGYLSLGTWIIVYLFAHVYKKGLTLQKFNDLTI